MYALPSVHIFGKQAADAMIQAGFPYPGCYFDYLPFTADRHEKVVEMAGVSLDDLSSQALFTPCLYSAFWIVISRKPPASDTSRINSTLSSSSTISSSSASSVRYGN